MINLNAEKHFESVPASVSVPRSTFDRSHGWKGTCKAGKLNCFLYDEILPGDDIASKVSGVFRMMTPYFPVLDDAWIDKYIFFIPNRLVFDHWKEFCGENNSSAWISQQDYAIPMFNLSQEQRFAGDFAHQIGIPISMPASDPFKVSALPFRAYQLVWNEWFRSTQLQDPLPISTGDTQSFSFTYEGSTHFLNELLPVNRVHDYFGSCIPQPQFGSAVSVALSGWTNVVTTNVSERKLTTSQSNMQWMVSNSGASYTGGTSTALGINGGNTVATTLSSAGTPAYNVVPRNLIVDLDSPNSAGDYVGVDIEALRLAVATQRILELLAVGGSRYIEFVRTMFGVVSPDARQQRPELLGHSRTHVRMNEVTQTSPTLSGSTPLGTVGANSKTVEDDLKWSSAFTEHGILLGLFCIRHNRSYSQGLAKKFTRKTLYDFFLPAMDNLGEQPVYKKEIYANLSQGSTDIFGYQEAWADMRVFPSWSCGLLDPAVSNTLGDVWTYTDYYTSAPTLSSDWIKEGDAEIARTLAVTDSDQFLVDIWIEYMHTRPMKVYSIPGLSDTF